MYKKQIHTITNKKKNLKQIRKTLKQQQQKHEKPLQTFQQEKEKSDSLEMNSHTTESTTVLSYVPR